jgi:methionyl-tRNA formyltransferase
MGSFKKTMDYVGSKDTPVNVTILCGYPNSDYARNLLSALNRSGVHGVNVVAADGARAPRVKTFWKKHGLAAPWIVLKWLLRQAVLTLSRFRPVRSLPPSDLRIETCAQGGEFMAVNEVNSEECCNALREMKVDLMVLAGTPIVRAKVLSVPRIGTLNAHQGALPRYRGMNVIEWAVFEGSPPRITIHFVDPGVDTGDIIADERVPVHPGDTLGNVRNRASTQQVDLLARSIAAGVQGSLPRRRQKLEEGRQYFAMHPALREIAESRLRMQISAQ